MTGHVLDRPVWHSLTGPQGHLARAHGTAVRMDPAVGPFAAMRDGSAAAQADLCAAVEGAGAEGWLVETAEVVPPAGLATVRCAPLTQMVAGGAVDAVPALDCRALGADDADAMAALARATEPGPWCAETWRYGGYYGVREGGRLIAMAGTRMRPGEGFAEVSGVCTDPAYRGRGLARGLMLRVMADFAADGLTAFLHCYSANRSAIALYRSMGFAVRREMVVTILAVEGTA